jgi:TonB-dependent receptor
MNRRNQAALKVVLLSSCLLVPSVAAAQRTAPADTTTGTPTAADTNAQTGEGETIVVTGQRASDRASLQRKRAADNTTEVVSADDAGKLPDQNVAEAARRLTGVSVATDKGEGRYIIIRGIEPNLANVTINNQTASAPEPTDRNVKLDDIPSGLIGSVTVVKTLTPDLDANAIAGQVDIATVSAFDKRRLFGTAKGVLGLYEDTDRKAREFDIGGGTLFGANDQFGLVLAVNYSRRPSYSEDVLSTSRQLVNDFDLPAEMDQRVYDPAIRTRKGAIANFDWRPSNKVKVYLRGMYSSFDDLETRNRFRFFFPADNNVANTTALPPGYGALDTNGGSITSTTARRLLRSRHEKTQTTTISAGTEFDIGVGEFTIEATHATSKKNDPERDEVEYRAAASTGVAATFTDGRELLNSFIPNAAALNPANFRLNNYRDVSREAGEDLDQVRVDFRIPFDSIGDESYFKIGAKYLKRDRFQDQTGRTLVATGAAAARTLTSDAGPDVATTFDGRYGFGPTINFQSAASYVFGNSSLFTVNANDQISQSTAADYRVKETVTAGYAMASIRTGGLTIIPGVRVEHTVGDTQAITFRAGITTLNSAFDSFGHYSYTDWFPGVNVKYAFSNQLIARAAVTTAIGRPPFVDLAPTVSVDVASNTVALGNANLKPQRALNLDAALEYYFKGDGGMSIAFFHKRIKNPVFATTTTQSGTFAGVALTNAIVSSFGNGDEGRVTGIELAISKPFTFLPSPLDGFGINANLTLTDSRLDVPGRTVRTPLVGQANTIASVQLYYEKYGITGRVAYSFHSAYLDTDGGLNVGDPSGQSDGYFARLNTFDARLGYRFTRNIEVFAEGTNLTDAQDYYFFSNPTRFREGEKYGRSLRLGLVLTY